MAELGEAALDLLDPKPGERILDIGCGDGALTHKIAERGADVVGVDNSPELVAAARAIGLDVWEMSATDMTFDAEFDAAFRMLRCTGSSTRTGLRARPTVR